MMNADLQRFMAENEAACPCCKAKLVIAASDVCANCKTGLMVGLSATEAQHVRLAGWISMLLPVAMGSGIALFLLVTITLKRASATAVSIWLWSLLLSIPAAVFIGVARKRMQRWPIGLRLAMTLCAWALFLYPVYRFMRI